MSLSIFLSYSTPHRDQQRLFLENVKEFLKAQGVTPSTLTPSNYDMDAPLAGIRRLMVGSCGLLGLAFRRSWISEMCMRQGADIDAIEEDTTRDLWLSSPYIQIEAAMAFQLGIPILTLKEEGVLAEGILEKGVTGQFLPEFACVNVDTEIARLAPIMNQWLGRARSVYDRRGNPPQLY